MKRNTTLAILALSAVALLAGADTACAGDALSIPVSLRIGGFEFRHSTVMTSAIACVGIFLFCWWLSRGLSKDKPSRGQVFLEAIVHAFDNLTNESLGSKERGRKYLSWIATLFLFIWASNMAGMIPLPDMTLGGPSFESMQLAGVDSDIAKHPGAVQPGFFLPAFSEPTSNVSVTLGMALLFVVLIGHGSAIRYNGIVGYIKDYFSPGGVIGVVMSPLNIVGKLAEVISISFRLFGNIFGGAVIIAVVSSLVHYIFLPPMFLYGFFGLFVGTVQAFVFTMLALTYISSGAAEAPDEEKDAA